MTPLNEYRKATAPTCLSSGIGAVVGVTLVAVCWIAHWVAPNQKPLPASRITTPAEVTS